MPICVKPNPKKLKRASVKSCETGFLDYFYLAIDENFVSYPFTTSLTPTSTYEEFGKAFGNFGVVGVACTIYLDKTVVDSVWSKIEVKKGSLKLQSKPLNLKDSSAVENTVSFELDSSMAALGFREMYKRTDIQVVLPKANGDLIWVGRQDSAAQIADFTDDQSIEKSADELQIKSSPQGYRYLTLFYFIG